MARPVSLISAIAFAGTAAAASAQVNFNIRSVSEPITAEQIRTGAAAGSTFVHDGIALAGPDQVFVIHRSASAATILRMSLSTGLATASKTFASVASDLGGDYLSAPGFPILQGELVFNPAAGTSGHLYFVDSAVSTTGDYALIELDVAANAAGEVFRGEAIGGWSSHDFLSDGTIVGALGEEREAGLGLGEPELGIIDPASMTPAWETKAEMDDFITAAGLDDGEELPPETVAANRADNTVYVFGHDNYRVFRVSNILSGGFDPETDIEELDIPEWNRADETDEDFVDLHGMAVDEDGNLYRKTAEIQ